MDPDAEVLPFPTAPRQRPEPEEAPTAREAIGDVLRAERHDQARTLADVAADAHVSLPYLSEVERGRKDVSSEVLGSVAAALDLPLPVVFERAADRLRAGLQRGARMQLLAA